MGRILVRKISAPKWANKEYVEEDKIPGDAITADLRTTKCTLSCWLLDSDQKLIDKECNDAVLALVSSWERLDRIDVTWMNESEINDLGIGYESTDGATVIPELKELHVDLVKVDMVCLCGVARLIKDKVSNTSKKTTLWVRYSMPVVRGFLAQAVLDNRLSLDDVAPKVRVELEAEIKTIEAKDEESKSIAHTETLITAAKKAESTDLKSILEQETHAEEKESEAIERAKYLIDPTMALEEAKMNKRRRLDDLGRQKQEIKAKADKVYTQAKESKKSARMKKEARLAVIRAQKRIDLLDIDISNKESALSKHNSERESARAEYEQAQRHESDMSVSPSGEPKPTEFKD